MTGRSLLIVSWYHFERRLFYPINAVLVALPVFLAGTVHLRFRHIFNHSIESVCIRARCTHPMPAFWETVEWATQTDRAANQLVLLAVARQTPQFTAPAWCRGSSEFYAPTTSLGVLGRWSLVFLNWHFMEDIETFVLSSGTINLFSQHRYLFPVLPGK